MNDRRDEGADGGFPGDEPAPHRGSARHSPTHEGSSRMAGIEHRFAAGLHAHHAPAWLRPTQGEHRFQVTLAILAAIGLQIATPSRLAVSPRWVLPALESAVLVGLIIANPGRISRRSAAMRYTTLALVAAISFANAWSLVLLLHGLVTGTEGQTAGPLLLAGAVIWTTNVIVFSLWYWEFDRGGPGARAEATHRHPDLLFPQMTSPDMAAHDWEPAYFDYLYTSFTNASAFSPTDTMPLSRWTKMVFMAQSVVSLVAAALVVARAVNILK